MTSMDDESIDLACTGLTAAVKKYCKKRKRDSTPTIQTTVQHACHILRQLTLKRRSLEHGLQALEISWKSWYPLLVNTTETTAPVLTHVFHQYLRLHDGRSLLTSGECRHPGDVQSCLDDEKFKSQLNQQALRGDGYTKLFSSQYYSGTGWDELFDTQVGVIVRLQQALGNSTCWDTLLDNGAQAFESCLDQHETACQDLQSRFEVLRFTITKDLLQHCSKVDWSMQDKMESLQVTRGTTQVTLERRANAFQVHDPKGCLPNGWTVADWKRAMEYPVVAPKKKKKKRALAPKKKRLQKKGCVNDEESDSDIGIEKSKTVGGLRVEVKNKVKEENKEVEISLADLKEDCEVDAEALEQAREDLEAENTGVGHTSLGEGLEAVDEACELKEEVADSRTRVERMKRVVARVNKRQDEFDEELWDARECLREASMTLGSNLLSLCAVDKDSDICDKNLEEARLCFCEARDLVKKQESVHLNLCKQTNDNSFQARAIRRKLLLLRGRAHVNLGIALFELSLMKCPEPVRKGLENEATAELQSAESCANSIRAHAVTDATKGASPSEIAMDRLEADQLDALTNRWLGKSLWQKRKRNDAVLACERGSRFFVDRNDDRVTDEDLPEAELELGVECFYVCTSLADLALDTLEKLQIVAQGHPKRQDCLASGQELLSIALEAYKRASLVSATLQKLATHMSSSSSAKDTLRSNGIITSQEIEKNAEQMKCWWEEKKKVGIAVRQTNGTERNGSDQLRNDLFSSGTSRPNHSNTPVKRFTVNESSSRRASKRRNQGGSGSSRSSTTAAASSGLNGSRNSTSNAPIRYRKWGDALLPQRKTDSGETVPLMSYEYPACAPPLPPGFTPYKPNQ